MIGTILRQRYLIKELLGDGGFGETYLAEDFTNIPVSSKPMCVVKRLKPEKRDEPETLCQFKEEATILHELGNSHDQIPKLIDYFQENRDYYLVQEYIDGHDLSNEIIQGKQWSEAEVIQLLQEILEVLAFVHQQGAIHRDIKPSNLMRRYSDCKLILIDFGIVKELSTLVVNVQGQMSSSTFSGTLGYMPSEQLHGHPKFCSDVYALGLTAIQALTGVPPQELPKDPNTLEVIWRDRTQVSDWLADILIKMMRYDFRQRYQSATEALQALNPTVVSLPALQLPPPVTPLEPFISNNKWGYKDKDGKVVIQPQYNSAANFFEGLARVRLGYKYGYIDQMGTVVIEPLFGWAGSFSEGLARVMNNSKFGYIDKKGEFVNQQPFDGALDFSEGLAAVMIDKKWGYINKRGELVIQPRFDGAENFSQERARVRIDWHWHYIDKTGNFINP